MTRQVVLALLALLGVAVGPVRAQSIGIFADSSATSCNIDASHPFHIWYIVAVNADAVGGFRGVEFRVDLNGATFSEEPIISTSATQTAGDLFSVGVAWGWDACQHDGTVIASVRGTMTDVQDRTYRIVERGFSVAFPCPLFYGCDEPVFTKVCVAGGEAFVNSERDCTVAVDDRTWSQLKGLFQH